MFCGEWLSFGAPDLANDQRSVAAYHACWTSEPLQEPLHVFGRCDVEVTCHVDTDTAHVYVALCHVMTTNGGGYRLLTYGVQSLNGDLYIVLRIFSTRVNVYISALVPDRTLTPSTELDIAVRLDTIGYTLPAGDRVLMMVAPGSFPLTWPGPAPCCLTITSGRISLPTCDLSEEEAGKLFAREDRVPRLGPCKEVEVTREEAFSRDLSFSLSGVERTITMRMDEGCKYYPDVDTEIDEVNEDVYSISGDDPLSASAICQRSCKIIYQVIISMNLNERAANTKRCLPKGSFRVANSHDNHN